MTIDATRGTVASLWRHPVKSMLGERCDAVEIGPRGVVGDRAFALVDAETGKVATAKDPRRWPSMFAHRAAYEGPVPGEATVETPDGARRSTDDPGLDAALSASLGRPVRLARAPIDGAQGEGYWPDHDWLPDRDQTFSYTLPPGTFFDGAMVHLLTTAALATLTAAAPGSAFDPRRFRTNLVIEAADGASGFVEDAWIGRTIRVGEVVLRVERPCPRCVMTTLPQGDLPRDPRVLRATYQANRGNLGVYAAVVSGGRVAVGDAVESV